MIEVLYVFQYDNDKKEKALERYNRSAHSLRDQDCKVIVFNPNDVGYKGVFNKPKFINYAVKNYIKGDYFIFSDVDLIYQSDYVQRMAKYAHDKKRVIPWNYNIYTECYSSDFNELMKLSHSPGGFAHGNGLIHRPTFMEIRGYNESFIGYGPEDDCFNQRIGKAGSELIYDKDIVTAHLWHEPLNRIQHDKNMKMYWKILQDIEKPNANLKYNSEKWGVL